MRFNVINTKTGKKLDSSEFAVGSDGRLFLRSSPEREYSTIVSAEEVADGFHEYDAVLIDGAYGVIRYDKSRLCWTVHLDNFPVPRIINMEILKRAYSFGNVFSKGFDTSVFNDIESTRRMHSPSYNGSQE